MALFSGRVDSFKQSQYSGLQSCWGFLFWQRACLRGCLCWSHLIVTERERIGVGVLQVGGLFSASCRWEANPRREPWGKVCHHQKPRQGRQNWAKEDFLSPPRGSDCQSRNPRLTPWATFYRCSAARCFRFEEFSFLAAEVVVNKGNHVTTQATP